MEYNEDFIKGLLFEKIAGTISESDDLIAEKAILANPDARKFWEELKTKPKPIFSFTQIRRLSK